MPKLFNEWQARASDNAEQSDEEMQSSEAPSGKGGKNKIMESPSPPPGIHSRFVDASGQPIRAKAMPVQSSVQQVPSEVVDLTSKDGEVGATATLVPGVGEQQGFLKQETLESTAPAAQPSVAASAEPSRPTTKAPPANLAKASQPPLVFGPREPELPQAKAAEPSGPQQMSPPGPPPGSPPPGSPPPGPPVEPHPQHPLGATPKPNAVPKQPSGPAQEPSGPPQQPSGTPQEASGTPQDSSGLPQDPSGLPQEAGAPPQNPSGLPQEPSASAPTESVPHPTTGPSTQQTQWRPDEVMCLACANEAFAKNISVLFPCNFNFL